jgi:predicted acylesterase/phospholipase RssA
MTSPATTAPEFYDCFVLSGGGSKGAYGAGVGKAIEAYRRQKGLDNPVCYIGASAGALNAYMLASFGADALIALWLSITNRRILGVRNQNSRWRTLMRAGSNVFSRDTPRSIYSSDALRALITEHASLSAIRSPLMIAVTDYTRGRLRAFYTSDIIDDFVALDRQQSLRRQRFAHLRPLRSDEALVDALTASASIPVFDAEGPDGLETGWFVDGGVGNNTPTREAAYFTRYLETTGRGFARVVYCVKQDKPRIVEDGPDPLKFAEILKRTLDVYHYVHTDPIVSAWNRINREVAEQAQKVRELNDWLGTLGMPAEVVDQIRQRVAAEFQTSGGRLARLDVPMLVIEPSIELGDTLEFDPRRAKEEISHGYADTLKVLLNHVDPRAPELGTAIDEVEFKVLIDKALFPRVL